MPPLVRVLPVLAAVLLPLSGCGSATTVTSFSQEQGEADFLQATLTSLADPVALADEYAKDPAAGLVRGGGSTGTLLVFLEPDSTDEQVSALRARLLQERGVDTVVLRRGEEAPALEVELPPSPG